MNDRAKIRTAVPAKENNPGGKTGQLQWVVQQCDGFAVVSRACGCRVCIDGGTRGVAGCFPLEVMGVSSACMCRSDVSTRIECGV